MKGSAKQIKWAEDIKAEALTQLELCRKDTQKWINMGRPAIASYRLEDIDMAEKQLEETFEQVEDASWIIDHRNNFSSKRIMQMLTVMKRQAEMK